MTLSELVKKYNYMLQVIDWMNRKQFDDSTVPTLFPNRTPDQPLCSRYIFSDSIILISHGEDYMSALKVLIYARQVLQTFLSFKWPIRGGISFGEIYEDVNNNLVIGEALTAAYELEKEQNWIGVAIDKSAELEFPELFSGKKYESGLLKDIFLKYPVPIKNAASRVMHTLNWRFNLIVENGTRSLFSNTNSEHIQTKVNNTLEYSRQIVESERIYVEDQSKLVVELRSFFVGSSEPPFAHGDDL